jgi:hypothetical protein
MNRRGVVSVLLYAGLAILFLVSAVAALLTYLHVALVGLEPTRAFAPPGPENAVVVETLGDGWWPSITVVGDTAPSEPVTVAAGWWLISPLLVLALTAVVVVWRRRRPEASMPTTGSEGTDTDTQPIPVAR